MNGIELRYSAEFYPCGVPPSIHQIGEPTTRGALMTLEQAMREMPDQLDNEAMTTHHFAPGLYARQYDMQAGDLVIGKIHKHDHLAMLVFGEATIADEFNSVRMTGPQTFQSKRGVKRAVLAHTPCRFMTFHPTEETDLVKIEDHVIAPSYEALDQFLLEQHS